MVSERYSDEKRDRVYKKKRKLVPEVVVTSASGLNVRKEPSTTAPVVRVLRKGTAVAIKATKDGWGQIESGWIMLKYTTYSTED